MADSSLPLILLLCTVESPTNDDFSLAVHFRSRVVDIQDSRNCPGLTTYYKRIGGLLNAYKRLGYLRPGLAYEAATSRQRKMLIRSDLMKQLIEQSSGEFREFRESEFSERY
jgi:hypothetical protein